MDIQESKVLALKYRPKTFSNLIGQEIMVETIVNSIKMRKVPNAYLLTGIRGVGKTTTARIIAKGLNCNNGIENLCRNELCEHCKAISNSNHIDVLEMDVFKLLSCVESPQPANKIAIMVIEKRCFMFLPLSIFVWCR
mgnify:CR=1 FL=1